MMVLRLSGGREARCCRAAGHGPSPQCTLSLGLPLRTRRQDTSSVGTLPPERVLLILQKPQSPLSSSYAVSSGAVTCVPGPAATPRTRRRWSGPNCLCFYFFTSNLLAALVFFLRSDATSDGPLQGSFPPAAATACPHALLLWSQESPPGQWRAGRPTAVLMSLTQAQAVTPSSQGRCLAYSGGDKDRLNPTLQPEASAPAT